MQLKKFRSENRHKKIHFTEEEERAVQQVDVEIVEITPTWGYLR